MESCASARHGEYLEVMLVSVAAALYERRRTAAIREETLEPSMDFSALCAVSRTHLSVLAELALGELRVRSDARFYLESRASNADLCGGYIFDDRRYAI